MNKLLTVAAKAYLDGGLSIIPINRKTKRPASWLLPQATTPTGEPLFWTQLSSGAWVETTDATDKPKGTWAPYQKERPTDDDINRWLRSGIQSIAIVTGAVSGNAEILDFDNHQDENWYQQWADLAGNPVEKYGLPLQRTGSGGYQLAWRCAEIAGNQKLAWASAPEEAKGRKCMIETRGEGGYALLPPSMHPSGRQYELLQGRFSQIPTITPEVRNHLLSCARQLNQVELPKSVPQTATYSDGPNEVVDAYNQRYSIEEALTRYGYTHVHGNRWSRPGKADSAGVHVMSDGRAYAHSSNDLMAGDRMGDSRPFSAFDLFAYYEHGEDYKAATKAAAQELGIERSSLHTLIYVEGYPNAAAVREVMFPHGWVARGFRATGKINLDSIERYTNIIVWAYSDRIAVGIASAIAGAHAIVVPNGLDAVAMQREGILQPYLEAVLADAKARRSQQPEATIEDATPTDDPQPAPVASTGKPPLPAHLWIDDLTTLAEAIQAQAGLKPQYITAMGMDKESGFYFVRCPNWKAQAA
jgi:hypothetical protein